MVKNFLIQQKKSTNKAIKRASKRAVKKTAEATGDLIGNKTADKVTGRATPKDVSILKKPVKELPINDEDAETTTHKKKYISPEERQQIIDELRLVPKNY